MCSIRNPGRHRSHFQHAAIRLRLPLWLMAALRFQGALEALPDTTRVWKQVSRTALSAQAGFELCVLKCSPSVSGKKTHAPPLYKEIIIIKSLYKQKSFPSVPAGQLYLFTLGRKKCCWTLTLESVSSEAALGSLSSYHSGIPVYCRRLFFPVLF